MILLNCVHLELFQTSFTRSRYLQMRNSIKIQDCLQEIDEEDETASLK